MKNENELSALMMPLRAHIDAIDEQLLTLLNQRAELACQVGQLKKRFNAPVFQNKREQQVIARLQALNNSVGTSAGESFPHTGRGAKTSVKTKTLLQAEQIAAIWREIMAASRALEKPLTTAFLGPTGTYSEQAMFAYFGHSIHGLPCLSIDEIFYAVIAHTADFGVVPIENSTEGAISRTLDLLLQLPVEIRGEIALPIHHHLLTRDGDLKKVTRICAHAQALAQCQQWLSTHLPHIMREAVSSNAQAAQMAAQDSSVAAIAGESAATHYHLQMTQTMIQDDPHNRTRFAILGGPPPDPSGNDQTSLIFSVKNVPGAVFRMLEPLACHGVSMTRFESRPAKNGAWEYSFYIDIEGHRTDAPLAAALAELDARAAFMKVLGSYPKAIAKTTHV